MGGRQKALRKELGLLDVYAIATGTTLSAGFFLLPGLAAAGAGPAMVLSYMIAAVPMVPAMFCAMELATAMPRAGGTYYFLDRSLGPLVGTIGGVGTWLALVLKTSFALVGLGAYLKLFWPQIPILPIGVCFAVGFGLLSLAGTGKSGRAQLILVIGLLAILAWFIAHGALRVERHHFDGFFVAGFDGIMSTAGLVYISYIGVTKVASVSEEVRRPERNLPWGVFLGLGTAVLVYAAGTVIMVGVVPASELAGQLTPVAVVADRLAGRAGVVLVSVAAVMAFASVANAGILSASRYPLAMSRDHRLPRRFATLGRRGTPTTATLYTVAMVLVCLFFLDPAQMAKLASAFQLLVFSLVSAAVIVMRESHIESYDPGYRAPGYPWLPLFGILSPWWLVFEMGWLPSLFTVWLIAVGFAWYRFYVRKRVVRRGAIYHVFERLGRSRFKGLDRELRGILKEKGLREEDPFEEIVSRAVVLDVVEQVDFEDVVARASARLTGRVGCSAAHLADGFLNGTRMGATPVAGGAALPHLRLAEIDRPELVLVRCRQGVRVDPGDVFGETHPAEVVHALFFLVSPDADPGLHLRILAHLAGQIDRDGFLPAWAKAHDKSELMEAVLRDEWSLSLTVCEGSPTVEWRDRPLRDISLPEDSLVVLVRHAGVATVPHGDTVLHEGDRVTLIGGREGIRALRSRYASPV